MTNIGTENHLFKLTEPTRLYIRVLLTKQCNSKCIFCFRESGVGNDDVIFGLEFLRELAIAADRNAITKIHFTGGEPLLVKEIADYVRQVTACSSTSVGLTTNGILLNNQATNLYAAGLRRINISLPTLRSKRYRAICGQDMLQAVLTNIDIALDSGFWPVKINIPVYKENVDEMREFMEYFLRKDGVILRFFSILPNGGVPESSCLSIEETTTRLNYAIEQLTGLERAEATYRVFYRPPFVSDSTICKTCIKKSSCQDQAKAIRISLDGKIRLCVNNSLYSKQIEHLSDIDHAVSQLMAQYYC